MVSVACVASTLSVRVKWVAPAVITRSGVRGVIMSVLMRPVGMAGGLRRVVHTRNIYP
ncbi:hypothetical protein MBRU_19140 [Mycolicibacterium brumae DSM 44177]|nr:hypothetical protein MBRU_19140 [Mycolicibacterium brumae DSM 44177]